MSQQETIEIQESNNVPPPPRGFNFGKQYQTLTKKYFPILAQLEDVQLYRSSKDDILTSAQILVLKYALSPEKLQKASFSQLCQGFEILGKMQRLEAGQSTENHAILGSLKLELPKD